MPLNSVYQKFGKRVTDITLSLLGLLILSPILLIIAALIKLDSKGPIIFKQKRAGKGGQPFIFYKFRSMVTNAEELKSKYLKLNEASGPVFKIKNDPRYTKIGKFLSHSGLDELPQLVNILKGEMSLVGPRPLPIKEEAKIPLRYRSIRHSVRPGLACSWLVNGAHRLSFRKWMELDMENIKKSHFLYDLGVFLATVSLGLNLAKKELSRTSRSLREAA